MENNKISFEQLCDREYRRSQQMTIKTEAIWATFLELDGIINILKFAKKYFGKSHAWFSQKLHGIDVCNKRRAFTKEECAQLADALKELSKTLAQFAEQIESAEYK